MFTQAPIVTGDTVVSPREERVEEDDGEQIARRLQQADE